MKFSDIKDQFLWSSLPFRKKGNQWVPEFTRYWLKKESSLGVAVSTLESKGYINIFEKRIENEPQWLPILRALHQKEVQVRIHLFQQNKTLLPPHEQERLGALISTPNIGIGGIRKWQHHGHIKCLHLWVAYALGEPEEFSNPIALWTFEELKKINSSLLNLIENWEENIKFFLYNPKSNAGES